MHIHGRDKEAFRGWNSKIEEVKAAIVPMLRERLKDGARDQALELHKTIFDTVEWCILMACMELEYAALEPPRFYDTTTDMLLAGHLVCGWSGVHPNWRFAAI